MRKFKKLTSLVVTTFLVMSMLTVNVVNVMADESGVETIYYHDYDASKDINMTAANGWEYDEECWEGSPNGIRLKYASGSKNILRYKGNLGKNYTIDMTVTGGMGMLYGYFWLNVPETATFDGTNFSDGWKMYNNGTLTGYTGGTGAYSGEVEYASTTDTTYKQINKEYTKFKISLTMKDDGQTLVYTLKSNDGTTIATSGDIDLTKNGAWSYLKDTTGGFAIRNNSTDNNENYFIIIHDLKITKPVETEYTVYEHDYSASKDTDMTAANGWTYDEECWEENGANGIRLVGNSGSKNILRYDGNLGKNYTVEMTVTGGATRVMAYFWLNVPKDATVSGNQISDGWRLYSNGELFGFNNGSGISKGNLYTPGDGAYNDINKAYTKFKISLEMKDDGQTLVYTLKNLDGTVIRTSGDIKLTSDWAWSTLKDVTGGFAVTHNDSDSTEFIIIHDLKITKPVTSLYEMSLECTQSSADTNEIGYNIDITKFGNKSSDVVIGVYDESKSLIGFDTVSASEIENGINKLSRTVSYDSTKVPKYLKSFMWENFVTLTPLCASAEADI